MAGELTRRGFLTGGTWCLDRNRLIDRWPQEDRLATAWGLEERGGGSACNLAIAVRRLDPAMPVATIALIGDDQAGTTLVALAGEAGIPAGGFQVSGKAHTHVTDCFVSQESGMRTHITDKGAADFLSPDHFHFSGRSERIFHLGLPGVHDVMDAPWRNNANGWVAVLKAAQTEGLETSLELVTLPHLRQRELIVPCLQNLDYLVVNDSEIAALAGIDTQIDGAPDPERCMEAAQTVLAMGSMKIVGIHSPDGAVAVARDGETVQVPSVAIPRDEIAGPNGAGDAFTAGFLYGVHEGWTLHDSLQLAHASAACSLRSTGTTDGIDPWAACLETARSWGYRDNCWL